MEQRDYRSTSAKHEKSVRVVVRMGREQWVVGGDEPASTVAPARDQTVVEHAPIVERRALAEPAAVVDHKPLADQRALVDHKALADHRTIGDRPVDASAMVQSQVESSADVSRTGIRRKVRDAFQVGLIFGLAMGCLGLILFHQMPSAPAAGNVMSSAWPTTAALSGPQIVLPATNISAVEVGTYPNASAAAAAQTQFKQKGVQTVLYPNGAQKEALIAAIAMQPGDLQDTSASLQHRGISAQVVQLSMPTKAEPTLPALTKAEGQALTRWLSAEVSAMNALAAWMQDGESERDASTAYTNANKIQPSAQSLAKTGAGATLNGLVQQFADAYHDAANSTSHSAAMTHLMTAYSLLAQMKMEG